MDLVPVQGDILQFIKAGASRFILKDASLDEFLETIRAVAGGKNSSDHLTHSLFRSDRRVYNQKRKDKTKECVKMTNQEKEVIELIADALTNKEISQNLISQHSL